MKKLIVITALIIGSLHATETPVEEASPIRYRYAKVSDQWGIYPGLGIGLRSRNGSHGFDIDLTGYSYFDAGFSVYGKGHYLFYPMQKNCYLGIGAGVIGGYFSFWSNSFDGFLKPTLEGIVGYEWNTEKRPLFLQLEVGGTYGIVPIYPALSFGVGF